MALLIMAALLPFGGVVLLRQSSVESTRAAQHRDDVADLDLLAIRLAMSRAQVDELTIRLLLPFGIVDSDQLDSATSRRIEAVDTGLAELRVVARRSGPRANQARQVLEVFQEEGPSSRQVEPNHLLSGSGIAQFEAARQPSSPATTVDSLSELAWLDQAGVFTLHEALIATYNQSPVPADEDTAIFFERTAENIANEGGFLGPNPQEPLYRGWIPIDDASVHEYEAIGSINKTISATGLWESDQWVRSWSVDGLGPAPFDIAVLAPGALEATDNVRSIIDTRQVERRAASAGAAASASDRAALARFAAVLALAATAVALGAVSRIVWLRSHELRRQVNVDPLTGAGTRNLLQTRTEELLSSSRLTHHTIVMIDMDRFKVANDTYGHAAGDLLLQQLNHGLRQIADSSIAEEATVVRLGGDEFVLTLHQRHPISENALRQALDSLRAERVPFADSQGIPLEFSYGIESATGNPNLQDLLDAADLAAYAQKAARRVGRKTLAPSETG